MTSIKKNTGSQSISSKGNKYSPLREESDEKTPYVQLWNEAMDMGLISEDRESRKEYYHMVYRKHLLQSMKKYKEANNDKERKELSDKFEANLVRECKKKDLWEEGMENGMIYEEYPAEDFHYTTYKLEDLEKMTSEYKALKDEEKKEKFALRFEKSLKVEEGNKISSIPVEASVKRPGLPPSKGPSFAKVVGVPQPIQKQTFSHQVHHELDDEECPSPLLSCWQRGLACGFIHPKNRYHRGIPNFITFSELDALLKDFSTLGQAEKTEMAIQFKEELDHFNEGIPAISRSFKVVKNYGEIWKKAVFLGIVPEDIDYQVEYSEWLSSKDLVAYIHTVGSLTHRRSRATVKEVCVKEVLEMIGVADHILSIRKTFSSYSLGELVSESNTNKPSSRMAAYSDCESCNAKLDKNDLALAMAAWVSLDNEPEEARTRYLRWHAYRKFLHSQCPKN